MFCPSHFNDHRRQLSAQLESIKENCNQVAMKTQETIQTQRNGSSLLSQIDEWERSSIEKVARAADNARQQAIQLMRRKKTEIIEGLNIVNGEIRTRQGADDYFEQDLERLKKAVNQIHTDLDQFIRRPIELNVKRNDQSEWNNLISINHHSIGGGTRNFQEPVIGKCMGSLSSPTFSFQSELGQHHAGSNLLDREI